MSLPPTMQRTGRADWTLMTAIHEALRRDLDQLLNTTASHASARARWRAFRHQLCFHLAAEHAATWPRSGPSWPATRRAMPCSTRWTTSSGCSARCSW